MDSCDKWVTRCAYRVWVLSQNLRAIGSQWRQSLKRVEIFRSGTDWKAGLSQTRDKLIQANMYARLAYEFASARVIILGVVRRRLARLIRGHLGGWTVVSVGVDRIDRSRSHY